MIQMEIEVCIVDDLPIDISPAYDAIRREMGEEAASKWTDIVVVPPDDDA